MNLSTLEVPVEEAKAKVVEYRALLREERTKENEALARAYTAATKGHALIRLTDTILAGGVGDDNRPKLAITRATATRCWVTQHNGHIVFTDNELTAAWNVSAPVGDHHVLIAVPADRPYFRRGQTMVPNIPAKARQSLGRGRRLAGCHVLWEVEKWEPAPPIDPALLHRVTGDLWEVLATWDLTELERAVLAGTR
jgi:hypothetical protein